LYRIAHKVHHRNTNTGAWSGMSMHPIEHILYFSGILIHWIIPSHPLVAMYHVFHAGLAPTPGHTGYEKMTFKNGVSFQLEIICIIFIINILNVIIQEVTQVF
jgi:sterol desaturase/sphingolipid hydroxylase (fatty acid hydroxylase superfamily)